MSNLHNVDSYLNNRTKEMASAISFDTQKVFPIDSNVASVLISVHPTFHNRLNDENMTSAVEKAMEGIRYCPNSLHRVDRSKPNLFRMFVRTKREVMPVENASANGLKQINDTVFQDDNDNIWTVEQSDDGAFLVSTVDEDIAGMLNSVRIRSIATASMDVDMEEDYGPGNVVQFYDIEQEEMVTGIAVDGARIFDGEKEEIHNVESAFAIAVDENRINGWSEIAKVTKSDKNALIAYMKKLYGHNTKFFNELKAMINRTVAV